MRTKIILLSSTVLLSAGITMHHFRYCPLQHVKSALAHHKTAPAAPKEAKATPVLALNK
ncbi:MAG TPA: hypothetical protein VHD83_22345 [Puia sp.]|nr:hypothetical protein [Puia sp.]